MNSGQRICQNCEKEFRIEPEDFDFYKKIDVPAPTWCPECRFKRRAVWRNETTLYNRTCALCGKGAVSMYNPKSPYVIYCPECWYSDKWDPASYAKDYDSSRPFLDQLRELMLAVPKIALFTSPAAGPNIRSEYTNFAGGNKDCYLIFNSGPNCENCAYSRGMMSARNVFDFYFGEGIENVYEGVDVGRASNLAWVKDAADCLDSAFLLNCTGASRCFGCVNLRHGSYLFFNEQLSEKDYKDRIEGIMGSYRETEEIKTKFKEHVLKFPHRENSNFKSINSSGDYITESKNCRDCFEVTGGENLRFVSFAKYAKDCYDMLGHSRKSELLYEGVATGWGAKMLFSWAVETCQNVAYGIFVRSSEDCFGCDAVKNGKFMILNKRYEEAEYRALLGKIIEEMTSKGQYGEFFPPSMAPFAYNEAVGQDNFPLTKEEALAQGFRWQDEIQMTKEKETLKPEDIPDHIKDVQDSITNEILACIECGRNYRIIPAELAFYKQMILPIPRRCFYCRHKDRIRRRGPMRIFERQCAKCSRNIETTYAPERPEIVYCEECYQKEVV